MKKAFLILVAIIGLGISANAQCPCTARVESATLCQMSWGTTSVCVSIKIDNCDCSKIKIEVTPSYRISHLLENGSSPATQPVIIGSSRSGYVNVSFELKTKDTDYTFSKSDFSVEIVSKEQ